MFRSSAPLNTFSAKINMAYLIGLCSKETCKEMHTIRDIRNEFAHKGMTRNFESQCVKDLANNLTFGKRFGVTIQQLERKRWRAGRRSGLPIRTGRQAQNSERELREIMPMI